MALLTKELEDLCDKLPPEKLAEVVDFARFLSQQQYSSTPPSAGAGDAAWERILDEPAPRRKLDRFVQQSLAEGDAQPLDLSKL